MQNLTIASVLISCAIALPVIAEPLQVNSQRATGSATATGANATAITQIRQESNQKRDKNGNGSQISQQRATTNAVANGDNTTAGSSVNQQSSQIQFRGDAWTNPQTQISTQKSRVNNNATGGGNTSLGGTLQQNTQSQSGF